MSRRLDTILITGIGVLLVHHIAYAASTAMGSASVTGHGHLTAVWIIGGFAAIGALATSVVRSLRARHHDPLAVTHLTFAVVGGYTSMEAIERLADGLAATSLITEPVFWLGLAASPLVAVVLRQLLHTATTFVAAVISSPRAQLWAQPVIRVWVPAHSIDLVPVELIANDLSRRGPPSTR